VNKCSRPNCERAARSTGLCSAHYERKIGRSKKPMDAPIGKIDAPCSHPPCEKLAKVKGFCEFHYRRHLADRNMDQEKRIPVLERFKPGTRFSRLAIVKYLGPDNRGRKWFLCLCDCGNEVKTHSGSLSTKNTRSCGCLARDAKAKTRLADDWGVVHQILLSYKRHARNRDFPFDLTEEQFRHLIDAPCHYCGDAGSNVKKTKDHPGYRHNGIDRVDNTHGYSTENCVSSCVICNRAKNNLNCHEFEKWIYRLMNHQLDT
jgi:hypothetical protein